MDITKRVNLAIEARYSLMDRDNANEVQINAYSGYISVSLINNGKHRVMMGPGFSIGNYRRFTSPFGFEKEYKSTWVNFAKMRYDYRLASGLSIGTDMSLYGDDGDGSFYFGLVLGYRLI